MSDEPNEPYQHFATGPIVAERNTRRLVDVLAQFPEGATSKDLQIRFEQVTTLKRQSYFDALRYGKFLGWIVGGGQSQLYQLNPDGSWKPPLASVGDPIGPPLSRDQLEYLADSQAQRIEILQGEVERLRDWACGDDANGAGVAVANLVKIVADNTASPRQRIRAAAAILGYKTQDNAADFAKKYLESLCGSDEALDYQIDASEILRKHESPRVTPGTIRPDYEGGSEADRIATWRHYEEMQLRYQIAMETHDVPKPGWNDAINSDSYEAPPGWPPKLRLPSPS
jgi:hypothetical protein